MAPKLVGLAAILCTACATARPSRVAWPAPPATERIRLVRTYSSGADVETTASRVWRSIAALDAPNALYHPVGVAVTREGDLLAVTDQALGGLFLFDIKNNELRPIPRNALGAPPLGVTIVGEEVWTVIPERRVALSFSRDGRPLRSIDLADCERPTGIAIDAEAGNVFVTDTSSSTGKGHDVHVHALDTGAHKATIGHKGDGKDGLFYPTFLALAPGGGVYVADTMNARVVEFTADGTFVRQFGERGDRFGHFDKPKGVATDTFGNVYVADSFFSVVQIFNADAHLLLFFGGAGDSPGFLSNPAGIAIDGHNRIYVANGLNFRVDVYDLVNTSAADSHTREPSPTAN